MPLMAAPAPTWADKLKDDIFKAKEEANGDLTIAAGILNEKYKWSMNDFKVRGLVRDKYPDLFNAWKAKYGKFFKMEFPRDYLIPAGVVALVATVYIIAKRRAT